ncbi:MAG: NGG1p interacting factor NIF3 [Caldiserica bacterium]|nr:MAG: NGG1p interacting factor NIF3 [Caldisericota bacterium]
MKLGELYKKVIEWGIEEDLRGKEEISRILEENKKKYEELKDDEKNFFDKDLIFNPYSDTRIVHGDEEIDVKSAVIGIDIDIGELLLADRLREKGKRIDVVISHHPVGKAYANFYKVMDMQVDIVSNWGIPYSYLESYMEKRKREVSRRVKPLNHFRVVDVAKILDIPIMCIHTPSDNHVTRFLKSVFENEKPYKLKDVIEILNKIPEYRIYRERGEDGAVIAVGNPERKAGKIFVDMTGGTEGPVEVIEKLVDSGVSTVVGMHFSEKHLEEAEKKKLNIIIAGHISSDVLGMNLLLDKLEKNFHEIEIVPVSGFYRVRRI